MNENNNVTENIVQETDHINTVTNAETLQKTENNRGLMVLVIVLLLIIIGLIVFIIFDKFVINNTDAQDDNKTVERSDKDKGEKGEVLEDNNISKERELKEEELKEIVTYFNKREVNGFVMQKYNDVKEIDIGFVLYNNGKEVTDYNEAKTYLKSINWDGYEVNTIDDLPTPITKVTKTEVANIMKKYTGMDDLSNLRWTYLKDYDAYYHMHGDTNYIEIQSCASGKIDKDGNYITTCTSSEGTVETKMNKKDNDYIFISNKCIKDCGFIYTN